MCPQFIINFSNKLDFTKPGWFIDGNKNKAMVVFKFTSGYWYISSGIDVANKFDFYEPTIIYLYFRCENNEFLMFEKTYHKILKNQVPPPWVRQIFEAMHPPTHSDDNDLDEDRDAIDFYKFDVKITHAMANSNQVFVCHYFFFSFILLIKLYYLQNSSFLYLFNSIFQTRPQDMCC